MKMMNCRCEISLNIQTLTFKKTRKNLQSSILSSSSSDNDQSITRKKTSLLARKKNYTTNTLETPTNQQKYLKMQTNTHKLSQTKTKPKNNNKSLKAKLLTSERP